MTCFQNKNTPSVRFGGFNQFGSDRANLCEIGKYGYNNHIFHRCELCTLYFLFLLNTATIISLIFLSTTI